jgi:CheY-like chemotaxis protein
MYRVLIADDNFEDRELLKLEIERALGDKDMELRFYEAPSVKQAKQMLKAQHFDLMTLDIQFDRLNEGLEALPEIFENYPTLNIIVISGKLSKGEIAGELFRFTKDNVLKGKRWVRHFDVMDKKDDKTEALRQAYSFAFKQEKMFDEVRELLLLAESYMESNDIDKCQEIYEKIQKIAPGERESDENLRMFRGKGFSAYDQALEYMRGGEKIVAALLLGHYIENRLKTYTRRILKRTQPGLSDCLKELERARRISPYKSSLFQQLLRRRNKAVHKPTSVTEDDFESVMKDIKMLEAKF